MSTLCPLFLLFTVARHIGNSVNANNGAQWSERWAGTNAIGTSIILKQPVQIFSSEHFSHSCHEWVCSSAPILDPLKRIVRDNKPLYNH